MKINRLVSMAMLGGCPLAQAGEEPMVIQVECVELEPQTMPAPKPWWMETSAFYGFAAKNLFSSGSAAQVGKVDMYAGDVTLGYNLDDKVDALTLRFGYGYGSKDSANAFRDGFGKLYDEDVRLNRFYLMPGYRWTRPLADDWMGYFGVNLGVDNFSVKSDSFGDGFKVHAHDSAWGFAYSGEIGFQYHWTKCFYTFAAYQFQGSTAKVNMHAMGNKISSAIQIYHTVRAGMGWNF